MVSEAELDRKKTPACSKRDGDDVGQCFMCYAVIWADQLRVDSIKAGVKIFSHWSMFVRSHC